MLTINKARSKPACTSTAYMPAFNASASSSTRNGGQVMPACATSITSRTGAVPARGSIQTSSNANTACSRVATVRNACVCGNTVCNTNNAVKPASAPQRQAPWADASGMNDSATAAMVNAAARRRGCNRWQKEEFMRRC